MSRGVSKSYTEEANLTINLAEGYTCLTIKQQRVFIKQFDGDILFEDSAFGLEHFY